MKFPLKELQCIIHEAVLIDMFLVFNHEHEASWNTCVPRVAVTFQKVLRRVAMILTVLQLLRGCQKEKKKTSSVLWNVPSPVTFL